MVVDMMVETARLLVVAIVERIAISRAVVVEEEEVRKRE
jgi:hypothetical protein